MDPRRHSHPTDSETVLILTGLALFLLFAGIGVAWTVCKLAQAVGLW